MLGKRKLKQIKMMIEIILIIQNLKLKLYKKRVTKRSNLKDIDECKINFKIAQGPIRKKILPYHLFTMNSTVIHGISVTLFFVGKWGFYPISRWFETQKENSFSARLKTLR